MSVIDEFYNKKMIYASKGRYAIYHILDSYVKLKGKSLNVLMPVLACESIPWAIKLAGCKVVYFDVSDLDLNGSIESAKLACSKNKIDVILLPSLYGNPADLEGFEKYCKDMKITLIDDAAQAFGSTIDGKPVGCFGNGGLFSFSAGKPTFGHLGAFFWSENDIIIQRSKHSLYHWIEYLNYFYNRFGDYNSHRLYHVKLFYYFKLIIYKLIDIKNDIADKWELQVLANIASSNISTFRTERIRVIQKVSDLLRNSDCEILKAQRGEPNTCKIVLKCKTAKDAVMLENYIKKNDCYCERGYRILDEEHPIQYPQALSVVDRIVEIPIVVQTGRNNKTIEILENYFKKSKTN